MSAEAWAAWISAVANVVVAVGLVLAYLQLRHSREAMLADHERARRDRAVDLIADWARNLNQRASAARKLVETFDAAQSKALFAQEEFRIEAKHAGLLDSALAGQGPKPESGMLLVNTEMSSELRWQIVTFLNNLEAIAAAWRHDVADTKIIEEEFRYLISEEKGQYILEQFRIAAGMARTYPAISKFVEHIRKTPADRPPVLSASVRPWRRFFPRI